MGAFYAHIYERRSWQQMFKAKFLRLRDFKSQLHGLCTFTQLSCPKIRADK